MEDIIQSLKKALVDQGWVFGEKMSRLGHPYEWVDGDRVSFIYGTTDLQALLSYVTMFYEKYPTPKELSGPDTDRIEAHIEKTIRGAYRHFAPFLSETTSLSEKESAPGKNSAPADFENSIRCTASARSQDYAAIKNFCPDLPKSISHVDIGPGLGSHAVYSLEGFSSSYAGIEASPHSYRIQRQFLRYLACGQPTYLDVIDCENLSLDRGTIVKLMNDTKRFRIRHIPSWYFDAVVSGSVDLVTATWVLNEVSTSAILWLVANAVRSLKKGGYFYIRDSAKCKPLRHSVDYDALLKELNFKPIETIDVENRVTFFGVPRVYQKTESLELKFEELVERVLGRFAIVSHGGAYNQNSDRKP